jgi:hypothetical protein
MLLHKSRRERREWAVAGTCSLFLHNLSVRSFLFYTVRGFSICFGVEVNFIAADTVQSKSLDGRVAISLETLLG